MSILKKIVINTGCALATLSLMACSGSDAPVEKEDIFAKANALLNSVEYTPEGLASLILGEKSDEEKKLALEAIILGFQNCDIKFINAFEQDCVPKKTLQSELKIYSEHIPDELTLKLLQHPSNKVRLYAANTGVKQEENYEPYFAAANEEEDPNVLQGYIITIIKNMKKTEASVAFTTAQLDAKDPNVRKVAINNLSSAKNYHDIPGLLDKILQMAENDDDEYVRNQACSESSRFYDHKAVAVYEKILTDPAHESTWVACLEGAGRLWLDYPFHGSHDEDAYKVTMNYMNNKDRNETHPADKAIRSIRNQGNGFDDWKKEATWFNPDAFLLTFVDIIKDENANMNARISSANLLLNHGYPKAKRDALAQSIASQERTDELVKTLKKEPK